MPRLGSARRFTILDAVLTLARVDGRVELAAASGHLGIGIDELRNLISELLLIEFRTADGNLVSVADGYYLTADHLVVDDDWLGDIAAHRITPDQALPLWVAASVYREIAPNPSSALRRATEKLGDILAVTVRVPVDRPPELDEIRAAQRQQRSLRFRYLKAKEDTATDREVLPYEIFGTAGHWYLWGPEVGDGANPKEWRIDRMTDVSPGAVRFEHPAALPERPTTDLSALTRRVEVRLPERLIRALPEPHTVLQRIDDSDGFVRLTVEVIGDAYLDHLLIALGPEAEILGPPEYRERRSARARELLDHFDAQVGG